MALYAGIDLHSTNHVLVIIDEQDRVQYEKRLANDLEVTLNALTPFRDDLAGLALESTYNWYWLADGLIEAGFDVHLANTARMGEYGGLKYTDDKHDARWLAHMLRLGILPEGYILPKPQRALRDLLRRRLRLVQGRSVQILTVQGLVERTTAHRLNTQAIRALDAETIITLFPDPNNGLAAGAHVSLIGAYDRVIDMLETQLSGRLKRDPMWRLLKSIAGVGDVLAWTILLETGPIERFAKVGHYASYSRCVDSRRVSNGKKKGENNRKNGNRYLAWAFVEAAHYAIRYYGPIKRFYQRKQAKTNGIVAVKAVAHKLARAAYYVQRDKVPFQMNKAFG